MMTSTGLNLTLKVKVTSGKSSLYSWDHILVHPKKNSSRWCVRVRPDANADADRSKTICRPPLKGGQHKKNFTTSDRNPVQHTLAYKTYKICLMSL